jgi:hypothetical protein
MKTEITKLAKVIYFIIKAFEGLVKRTTANSKKIISKIR